MLTVAQRLQGIVADMLGISSHTSFSSYTPAICCSSAAVSFAGRDAVP